VEVFDGRKGHQIPSFGFDDLVAANQPADTDGSAVVLFFDGDRIGIGKFID
jgi:hypothetical protein